MLSAFHIRQVGVTPVEVQQVAAPVITVDDEPAPEEYAIFAYTNGFRVLNKAKRLKGNPDGLICEECDESEVADDIAFQCMDCGEKIAHAKCLGHLRGCDSCGWWCRRCRVKARNLASPDCNL